MFSLFSTSLDKVSIQVQNALEPLQHRKTAYFNWSSVLFIDGYMHMKRCVPREHFFNILKHNNLEVLINHLLSLMFVAADRCTESDSPNAQLSLRNGIALIDHMLMLYNEWITIYHQPAQEPFSQNLLKQLVRMLLMTADEKLFDSKVLYASNRCLYHLLEIEQYSKQFLPYIFDSNHPNVAKAVFLNCLPRLLLYEATDSLRNLLPFAYPIMWSLCSYNNFDNDIQRMMAQRDDIVKLRNLIDLLMIHINRFTTKEEDVRFLSLRFLVNMCLYNPIFRALFASSEKFESIWAFLLNSACQDLNAKMDENREDIAEIIGKTSLVIKLLCIMFNNNVFVERIMPIIIEKQKLDFFERAFSLPEKKEAVNTGRLYSICSWCNLVLFNNIRKKKKNDETAQKTTLAFVDPEITVSCLRILFIISKKYPEKLIHDCQKILLFFDNLVYTLLSVIATVVVLAERQEMPFSSNIFVENTTVIMHLFSFFMEMQELKDAQIFKFHTLLVQHERVFKHLERFADKLASQDMERDRILLENLTHILNYIDYFKRKRKKDAVTEETTSEEPLASPSPSVQDTERKKEGKRKNRSLSITSSSTTSTKQQ